MVPESPTRASWHLLVIAQLLSVVGSAGTMVTLPWLVLEQGHGLAVASYVLAAEVAPIVLLGPWLTRRLDRIEGSRVMVLTDLTRGLLLGAIATLHVQGALGLFPLVILVAAAGLLSAPHFAAQRTLVTVVTAGESEVLALSARLQSAAGGGQVAGPALAGVLLAAGGAGQAVLANAVLVCASALVTVPLLRLRPLNCSTVPDTEHVRAEPGRTPARGERVLVARLAVLDAAIVATCMVAVPAITLEAGLGPGVAGYAVAAFSVGALLAAAAVAAGRRLVSAHVLARGGSCVVAAPLGVLLFAEVSPSGLFACLLVTGLGAGIASSSLMALFTMRATGPGAASAFARLYAVCHASMAAAYVSAGLVLGVAGAAGLLATAAAATLVLAVPLGLRSTPPVDAAGTEPEALHSAA